jgi:sugar lactone lactonase YvrE
MAAVEVFDDRVCVLGEGPYWDEAAGRMGWVDILGQRVLWRDASGGGAGGFATGADVGAAVPRFAGGLVLCLQPGPALWDPDGSVRPLGSYAEAAAAAGVPPAQAHRLRSNDAKVDPAGRLWLGTMAYDQTPGAGALYRLDPGADRPKWMFGDVTISNGTAWSPDLSTMYYVDTPTRRVDVFDYDVGSGVVGNRRVFTTVDGPGKPDGLCVDTDGGVWVALYGGGAVRRYTPDGRLDRTVELPTPQVTSCAFGGPGNRLLVITTAAQQRADDPAAGRTYLHEPAGVTGLPITRYAG